MATAGGRSLNPRGAAPVRALATAAVPGRVYLAGRSGLYRSDDWGRSWVEGAGVRSGAEHVEFAGCPAGPAGRGACGRRRRGLVEQGRRPHSGSRGGRDLPSPEEHRGRGLGSIQPDPSLGGGGAARSGGAIVKASAGSPWANRFPDGPCRVRAGSRSGGDAIVIATDRGVFRSADAGETLGTSERGSARSPLCRGADPRPTQPGDSSMPVSRWRQYEDLQQRAAPAGEPRRRFRMGSAHGRGVAVLVVARAGRDRDGALSCSRRRHRARPDRKGAPAERGSLVRVAAMTEATRRAWLGLAIAVVLIGALSPALGLFGGLTGPSKAAGFEEVRLPDRGRHTRRHRRGARRHGMVHAGILRVLSVGCATGKFERIPKGTESIEPLGLAVDGRRPGLVHGSAEASASRGHRPRAPSTLSRLRRRSRGSAA